MTERRIEIDGTAGTWTPDEKPTNGIEMGSIRVYFDNGALYFDRGLTRVFMFVDEENHKNLAALLL